MTYTILQKIAAILNVHVNMAPSSSLWILTVQNWTHCAQLLWALGSDKSYILDFVCFWTFFNKIIFPLQVHHCTIYVIYSDAAYSAEETVY